MLNRQCRWDKEGMKKNNHKNDVGDVISSSKLKEKKKEKVGGK